MVVSGMMNTRCTTYHREVKGAMPLKHNQVAQRVERPPLTRVWNIWVRYPS